MTERAKEQTRSLAPIALLYSSLAGVALIGLSGEGTGRIGAWSLLLWVGVVLATDVWSYRFSKRVHWSYGSVVIAAPVVLSEPGLAPAVAAILGAVGALTDTELAKLRLSRVAANAGQLALSGLAAGLAFEALRPTAPGPSIDLVTAVAFAFSVNVVVNAFLVFVGATYAYGRAATRGMTLASLLLGWRKVVAAVAVAAIASTVGVVGPAWIVFALVQIAALGAVPVVRARLESRRRDIMRAVISALNARGVVGSAHDHLEATAVTLGHRMGLTSDQIEQVRYLSLLYAMTDNFAVAFPRSIEDRLRGLDDGAYSSAILLGLPLSDVADSVVVRIAETAAEYEAMVRPFDDAEPMKANEAAAVLLRTGADPYVVAALLDDKPLPPAYVRVWEIDPGSPWRKPMRWFVKRSLPVRSAAG